MLAEKTKKKSGSCFILKKAKARVEPLSQLTFEKIIEDIRSESLLGCLSALSTPRKNQNQSSLILHRS